MSYLLCYPVIIASRVSLADKRSTVFVCLSARRTARPARMTYSNSSPTRLLPEADELGIPRGDCFSASRLELTALAVLHYAVTPLP